MSIEEGLYGLLKGDTDLAALLTTAPQAVRIYPVKLPQAPVLPCLTFQRISTVRDRDHDGPSGVTQVRFQLDAWAEDPTGAQQIANAVRVILDGYQGPAGGNGEYVHNAWSESEEEIYEDEPKLYRVSQDFFVEHEE